MKLVEWKLSPDFIPHQDFHKGYWLNINEPNPWYYFFPAQRSFQIPNNKEFYSSVDKELLNIIKLLHQSNIPTTPSCSGHFSSPEYYEKLYQRLKQNELKIKSEGVILNNKETGKRYFYKNPNYSLPWDLNSFVEGSLDYQTKGVIGFTDPSGDFYNYLSEYFNCGRDGQITLVFEKSNKNEEKRSNWNDLYKSMNNYLLS